MYGVPFDVAIHYDEPSRLESIYQHINNSVSWSGRSVRVVGFEEFGSCEVVWEEPQQRTTLQKAFGCACTALLFPLLIAKCCFRLTHHFHHFPEVDEELRQFERERRGWTEEQEEALAATVWQSVLTQSGCQTRLIREQARPLSQEQKLQIANAPVNIEISADLFQQQAICKALRYDPEPFCIKIRSAEGKSFLIPSKVAQGIYALQSGDLKECPFATNFAIQFLIDFSYGKEMFYKLTLLDMCDIHALSELFDYPKLKEVICQILFAPCNCHVERIRVLAPYFAKHPCKAFWTLFEELTMEESKWIDTDLIAMVGTFPDGPEKNWLLGFCYCKGFGIPKNSILGKQYLMTAAEQGSVIAREMALL